MNEVEQANQKQADECGKAIEHILSLFKDDQYSASQQITILQEVKTNLTSYKEEQVNDCHRNLEQREQELQILKTQL